ncbi:MAG: hypothetical protein AMJ95_04050 [Omnitrophica WOR_2 bacterium SM23_72]|nr:MAG: hypothetical protein AMJ95_04050 [Omnitrophica WOR_2 bacterium SM23_72]
MKKVYKEPDRRKFLRLEFRTPLQFKVCKKETISMLLEGYTSNISQNGLLCNMREKLKHGDFVWLSFDRATLSICEELEKRALVYQNGIIGKVVRIARKARDSFDVGVQFLTREEKNLTHIYPKMHFATELSGRQDEES